MYLHVHINALRDHINDVQGIKKIGFFCETVYPLRITKSQIQPLSIFKNLEIT